MTISTIFSVAFSHIIYHKSVVVLIGVVGVV
jgi:hypothetical protein